VQRLIAEHATQNHEAIHPRAVIIFKAYLRSYAFSEDVSKGFGQQKLNKKDLRGHYKWHQEALQVLHGTDLLPRIGVPQGGALSCFIANAVLHEADLALQQLGRRKKKALSYMRYCDDMILLCADFSFCKEAFETYLLAII